MKNFDNIYICFQRVDITQAAYCEGRLPESVELVGRTFCKFDFMQLGLEGRREVERLQAEAVYSDVNLDSFLKKLENLKSLEKTTETITSTSVTIMQPIFDIEPLLKFLEKALFVSTTQIPKPEVVSEKEEKASRDHTTEKLEEDSTAVSGLSTLTQSLTTQLLTTPVTRGTTMNSSTDVVTEFSNRTGVESTAGSPITSSTLHHNDMTTQNTQQTVHEKFSNGLTTSIIASKNIQSTTTSFHHTKMRDKNEGSLLVFILVPLLMIIFAWCAILARWHNNEERRKRRGRAEVSG